MPALARVLRLDMPALAQVLRLDLPAPVLLPALVLRLDLPTLVLRLDLPALVLPAPLPPALPIVPPASLILTALVPMATFPAMSLITPTPLLLCGPLRSRALSLFKYYVRGMINENYGRDSQILANKQRHNTKSHSITILTSKNVSLWIFARTLNR